MTTTGLTTRRLVTTLSSKDNVIHSYHDEEKIGLVEHLNFLLKDEPLLKSRIPINPKSDLIFDSLKDGVILCKLINSIKPGSINERSVKINSQKLNLFEMNVNLDICLKSARAIGCSTINIGPVDFQEGKRHLILSILWQLIKIDLLNKVAKLATRVKAQILDLSEKEKVDDMVADEILVRWVNHHLSEAGSTRKITNFSTDIKDCEVYIILFNQLSPRTCGLELLQESDLYQRALKFLENIDRINCKKFLTAEDIVNGNPRLNITFVAYIFNRFNQAQEEPPVVPSEILKSADEKIETNRVEIEILQKEIEAYQEKHLEREEVIRQIQQKIEETKLQDQEIEAKFEESVTQYKNDLEEQREEYEHQIKILEEQLKQAEEDTLPSEEVLTEMILQEQQEITQLLQEESNVQFEFEQLKQQEQTNQEELDRLIQEKETSEQQLEQVKQDIEKEKNEVLVKLEATGILETKKKLEEVKTQAAQLETTISELKQNEKQLKVTLTESKEDKKRILQAKKKIQDEIAKAKDNSEKMIKTRIETDRIIDKTTKQVKDIRYEIDRIKNDRIYTQQQTQVIKVETIEAEEQLEEIKVEKKRAIVRKEEIQEQLLEKEMELDQVLVEKTEKIETVKQQHREQVDKMKRQFDITKKENLEDRAKIKEKLVQASNELVKEEYQAETEQRELELLQMKQREFQRDIHMQSIEKEVLEQEAEKLLKETKKTEILLEQEREINQLLEEKNKDLYKEKSMLRENATQASIESYQVFKENLELEEKIETINDQLDTNLTNISKLEIQTKEDQADLILRKAELKDEKKRLKKLMSIKKEEEKEKLEQVEEQFSRELIKLRVQEESKLKEIQSLDNSAEDFETKRQRFEDRIARTNKEIERAASRLEKKQTDAKKSEDKKKSLESTLLKAKTLLEDSKKEKDNSNKDFESTLSKHKSLKESIANTSKSKKTAEEAKRELQEKLNQLKSQIIDKDSEHKLWKQETESKSKSENEKLRQTLDKEHSKLKERLEKQLKEEEDDFIKKKELQMDKLAETNLKLKKESERIEEKISNEKEDQEIQRERFKRKEERERLKKQKEESADTADVVESNTVQINQSEMAQVEN
eukprot:gene5772-7182_t